MSAVLDDRATEVEIFVVPETKELIYDDDKLAEWNQLNAELGIEVSNIQQVDKSPIPFMPMNSSMIATFETLCPSKVDYKNFKVSPIPLEVLKAIKMSVDECYFGSIEIWFDEKTKDPVCIGSVCEFYGYSEGHYSGMVKGKSKAEVTELVKNSPNTYVYTTIIGRYLIGKWGDVKYSFKKLTEMAKERYITEQLSEYNKQIKEYKHKIDCLQEEANTKFGA